MIEALLDAGADPNARAGRRRNAADDGARDRQRGGRAAARRPRRERQRHGSLARPDGADVGRDRESRSRRAAAHRARRRRQRAFDALRVPGADRRQRRHHPRSSRGRPHGPDVRRATGFGRNDRSPARGRRRHERQRAAVRLHAAPDGDLQRALRARVAPGRPGRERQRRLAVHRHRDAQPRDVQQPAEPARYGQRRHQPRPHHDPAGARRGPEPAVHEENSAAPGAGRHQRPAGRHPALSRHAEPPTSPRFARCSTRARTRTWRPRTARRR